MERNLMASQLTLLDNGPLKVDGEFKITDASGKAYNLPEGKSAFLCRCGLSANKPFCDGEHRKQGFSSEVKAV